MSRKSSGSFYNRNRRREPTSKHSDYRNASDSESEQLDYRRIRVIQKNLVYAIGLTDSISTNETLESDNYFGKYGRVLKTIINKSVNSQTKSQRNTCYVTYETELEASLAILVLQHMMQALDDYCLTQRPMKVSYGTTKYCSYFLKKYDCPNLKDCYFLHKWDVDNELTVDDNSKQVFNKQLKLAMAVIAENLQEALRRHRSNLRKKLPESSFPSIDFAVERLVDHGYITEDELDAFRQDHEDQQLQISNQSIEQNNCKTDSISTSGSPQKEDFAGKPQLPSDDFCVQDMIQKYISKQIMKQSKLSQSRFGFAAQSTVPLQDAQKIKKYIEVYIGPKKP